MFSLRRIFQISLSASAPLLLLLSGCNMLPTEQTVTQEIQPLLSNEPPSVEAIPLPQEEADIQQRIRDGFDRQLEGPFRARVESGIALSSTLGTITLTTPFTLEIASLDQTTSHMAIRAKTQEWETIHIGSNVAGDNQGWIDTGSGWQEYSESANPAMMSLMLVAGSPYAIYWDPPTGLDFRSRVIGHENAPNGLLEVYEVLRTVSGADGSPEVVEDTRVWLSAATGMPVKTENETLTIFYEQDDSIIVEAPIP